MSSIAAEVGSAFVSILPSLKGFSARLKADLRRELGGIDPVVGEAGDRAGRTFGNRMHDSLKSGLGRIGSMLKTGLVVATAAAAAGLGTMTVFGLKSAAALEQTTVGIEALLGSSEDAKTFLGELQEFSKKTPFEFAGVADASRRILAFGSAVGITRDEVIPTLTTIGDLVSVLGGTQENVDSVVRAFGQMSSKGKISQEELLQLAEALPGFNANAAIAAELGVPVGEAMEMITRGEVDAATGINALLKGMAEFPGAAGAMAKQSETLQGVFSTFKDTIGLALTNAFTPVIPAIKQALTDVTPVLGAAIDQVAPALGGVLTAVLPMVGALASGLAPVITPILGVLSEVFAQLTPVIEPLGKAFGEIVEAIAPLVPVIAEVVAEVAKAMVPVLHKLAPIIADLVPPLVDVLMALLPILPPLTDLMLIALEIAAPILAVAGALVSFLAAKAIRPLILSIGGALELLAKPLEFIAITFEAFAGWLMGIDWAATGEAIARPFRAAWDWITGVWGAVTGWFSGLASGIGRAFSAVGEFLAAPFVWAWNHGIKPILDLMIDGINVVIDGLNAINPGGDIPHIGTVKHGKRNLTAAPVNPQGPGRITAMAHGGIVDPSPGGTIVRVAEAGQREVIAPVDEIYDAIRAGSMASAQMAPAPQRVELRSSDPMWLMFLGELKGQIQDRFGGDVLVALGT